MDNEISNADLQRLLVENPLAAEQLRRIVAERQRDAALASLANQNGTSDSEISQEEKEAVGLISRPTTDTGTTATQEVS